MKNALLLVNLHDILTTMLARLIKSPNHSFFLFGPRGTGKSTWLRSQFPNALWKNLLLDEDYLPLLGDSSLLRAEIEAGEEDTWVVINEVQRIPNLLNEVHDLIARHGKKYHFAMSGSSARKLKRLDVNLLAGRAIERKLFPFVAAELGSEFDLDFALTHGLLPTIYQNKDYAVDILSAYVGTYLKQEIQQEALVEDIGSFHRFLKIAGIMNGEALSVSAVARDAGVARTTVNRYVDILVDTLVGYRLPGWQPKLKVREKSMSKFYLFDTGVVRTLTGYIRDRVSDLEAGKLLETYILHELRSAMQYQNLGGELSYYRTGAGVEVDFIWTRGEKAIGIEVKASRKWRREYAKPLHELTEIGAVQSSYVVYRGEKIYNENGVQVLPVGIFTKRLSAGEILC